VGDSESRRYKSEEMRTGLSSTRAEAAKGQPGKQPSRRWAGPIQMVPAIFTRVVNV
jgi:hypothetical protein